MFILCSVVLIGALLAVVGIAWLVIPHPRASELYAPKFRKEKS